MEREKYTTQIIRMKLITAKAGLCKATIYRMMAAGDFPKSIKLGKRAVGWYASDIENWLADRAKSGDA